MNNPTVIICESDIHYINSIVISLGIKKFIFINNNINLVFYGKNNK